MLPGQCAAAAAQLRAGFVKTPSLGVALLIGADLPEHPNGMLESDNGESAIPSRRGQRRLRLHQGQLSIEDLQLRPHPIPVPGFGHLQTFGRLIDRSVAGGESLTRLLQVNPGLTDLKLDGALSLLLLVLQAPLSLSSLCYPGSRAHAIEEGDPDT